MELMQPLQKLAFIEVIHSSVDRPEAPVTDKSICFQSDWPCRQSTAIAFPVAHHDPARVWQLYGDADIINSSCTAYPDELSIHSEPACPACVSSRCTNRKSDSEVPGSSLRKGCGCRKFLADYAVRRVCINKRRASRRAAACWPPAG